LIARLHIGYDAVMTSKLDILERDSSWAAPTEDVIRAWQALPRDEQLAQIRALLGSSACTELSDASFDDIIAAARLKARSRT
jgi:hypothetical protein